VNGYYCPNILEKIDIKSRELDDRTKRISWLRTRYIL